ncbi:zinc ribbon domain-containing protein [Oceanobacillus manasiensis]|uniref:zinc ribbon domain-containing protein n=1 Tax=Oceanobacillus manasiensis TaxID=586413 RepID=UPI0005A87BF6|nr:zinc ribbon domain-containing protein [Oceanobacillus manasiensis]
MKCNHCNAILKSNSNKFCPECGADLTEQKAKEEKMKRRRNKKTIIILVSVLVPISILTIFFLVAKEKFTAENTVASFEESVEQEDAAKLVNLLTPAHDSLEITEENTALFISYLKDHPTEYEELLNRLHNQVDFIKSTSEKINGTAYLDDMYGTVNIKQDGKEWLLFDSYQLQVVPAFLKLNTENKDVQLLINGEVAGTSTEEDFTDTYGPFMPGSYEVMANFENDYSQVEEKVELELFTMRQDTVEESFKLPISEISVESLLDGYTLAINGEKTDIKIQEGEQTVGILPTDGSVSYSFHKDFPWGEVSSEEEPLERRYVGLDTVNALTPEMQTDIMEQLNTTIAEYHQALAEKDVSIMETGVTDKMKETLKKRQAEIAKKYPEYEGKLIRAEYDLSKISNPVFDEELDSYTITMRAHYIFYEPGEDLGWLLVDREKEEFTRSKELTLVYDEDAEQWKLDTYETEYFVITPSVEKAFDL